MMSLAEILHILKKNVDESNIIRLSIRRGFLLKDAFLEAGKSKFNCTRLVKVNEAAN